MQKSMILTKERVHPTFIIEKMAIRFFLCFGAEMMSVPDVVRKAVIFRNVIIGGMLNFVRNSVEKR